MNGDSIISHSDDLIEVQRQAEERGFKDLFFIPVPDSKSLNPKLTIPKPEIDK